MDLIAFMAHLRLARHRSDVADLAAFQRVDYTALSYIRITNKTDGNLLLVRMELRELSKELNEGAFAKRVVGRRVEGNSGVARCKVLNISCRDPVWYEITLVDDEYDLFMSLLLAYILEHAFTERTHRVSSIQNV